MPYSRKLRPIISTPNTMAYNAITQTSATAPALGATNSTTPKSTDAMPPSTSQNSFSMIRRSHTAATSSRTPVISAQAPMMYTSTSAVRAGYTKVKQPPPMIVLRAKGGDEGEPTVHQRKRAPEQNQNGQRQTRPGEGQYAEQHSR